MGKPEKINVQLLRRDDFSAEDLAKWALKLTELSEELRASADVVKNQSLKTVRVDGATKISRGLKLVAEFSGNVTRAIRNKQFE